MTVRLATVDDGPARGDALRARSGDERVAGRDLVDLAGKSYAPARQDHDVLADTIDVSERVGRHDQGRTGRGDRRHELLEHVHARKRIEIRHRLVEQQQLRPLADRDRERNLRALARREPTHSRIERKIESACDLEVVGDAEVSIQRSLLPDEAHARQEGRIVRARRFPEHRDRSARGVAEAGRELQQCRLPRSVRPDQTDDLVRRQREIAVPQRAERSELLAQTLCLNGVHRRAPCRKRPGGPG